MPNESDARKQAILDQIYAEVGHAFSEVVTLEADAVPQLKSMVQLTVGHVLETHPEAWARLAFHNFIIGQAARIADRARQLSIVDRGEAAETAKQVISGKHLIEAGADIMQRTHATMTLKGRGCAAVVKDEELRGLPGDQTHQGPLCGEWLLAAAGVAIGGAGVV